MDVTYNAHVSGYNVHAVCLCRTWTVVELTSDSGEDVVAMLMMLTCHLSLEPLPLAHGASQFNGPRLKM